MTEYLVSYDYVHDDSLAEEFWGPDGDIIRLGTGCPISHKNTALIVVSFSFFLLLSLLLLLSIASERLFRSYVPSRQPSFMIHDRSRHARELQLRRQHSCAK